MEKPNLNLTKQRYQFNDLIISFRPNENRWEVIDPKSPHWNNVLFDINGYDNKQKCFNWAYRYIEKRKCENK